MRFSKKGKKEEEEEEEEEGEGKWQDPSVEGSCFP